MSHVVDTNDHVFPVKETTDIGQRLAVGRGRSWLQSILAGTSWLLLFAALAQYVLIRWFGDSWWFATILLFGPRWPLLIPIGVIAAACILWRPRLLWINLASGLLVLGPVMGFCVSSPLRVAAESEFRLQVMSFNSGGGSKLDLLRAEVSRIGPDVIAIQETPSQLPEHLFGPSWNVAQARGLTIASRYPILESAILNGSRAGRWIDLGLRARLATPAGEVWLCCLYMESPRDGFESIMVTRRGLFGVDGLRRSIERRDSQSRLQREWVAELSGPVILAGDFNQPTESHFFRRDWSSSFQDAFAHAGTGYGYTWFSSWHGVRIDHILCDKNWRVVSCHVADSTGGDHRPMVAEFVLRGA